MNLRNKADGSNTTFTWDAESLAPSLAVTDDWWNQSSRLQPLTEGMFEANVPVDPAHGAPADPSHLGPHRCPSCGAVIYSRRHRLCGVCAQPLPEAELFSESEARRLATVVEIERERHRKWLARTPL